jgi:hypothetical protein
MLAHVSEQIRLQLMVRIITHEVSRER